MSDNLYELPAQCDFTQVVNNSLTNNDCSPRLIGEGANRFTGLLINSPVNIVWPGRIADPQVFVSPTGNSSSPHKWMLAGLVQLPKNTLNLAGHFSAAVELVAVNQKTGKSYSGKMILSGYKSSRPPIANETELDKAANIKNYFNIDLVRNLDIPIESATYNVYATLGGYKSNILSISTKVN